MPTHLVAHLHFFPTQKPNKKMQKSYHANVPKPAVTMDNRAMTDRTPATNSTYKKLAVTCFADTLVVGVSSVLRMKFSAKTPRQRNSPKPLPQPHFTKPPYTYTKIKLADCLCLVWKELVFN